MNDTIMLCLVCGDKAQGKNFNIISCQSCKQFFRRHAFKPTDSTCMFDHTCDINVHTRSFCIECRLDKCITMGMKREFIKIHKNYDRKRQKDSQKANKNKVSYNKTPSDHKLGYTSDMNSPDIHYTDITSHTKHTNDYRKHSTDSQTTDPSELTSDSHSSEELSLSVIPVHRPLMDYRNQFNELEGKKLWELLTATQILNDRKTLTYDTNDDKMNNSQEMAGNRFEYRFMSYIQMSKRLSAFNDLCENDRMALIKGGCFDLTTIRK
ncbi:unnamed protein product [Oppiella nova]|uniref:Nuclear receptor domain-containing protein n=1 Tax=Oppiella nova TaxID=334625 RepID=A0A7R9M7K1_9ACAR|nr:unnamed protein product [Oppiella nova]CAG2172125.1 unnamed protein product [Oppiella nova]